jgi:uncharacterized repeat protein (TIGR01451 family)
MFRMTTKQFAFALTVLALAWLMAGTAGAQATLTIGLAEGADPNGEPTYTASVSNTTGFDAGNLTVTYTLPASELPISPSPGGGCLFTPGAHLTVVCQGGDLAAHQTKNFVIAVHPVDTAPQDVNAVAHAANVANDVSAFTTSTITEVGLTEMQVTLTSTNPGKVGENLVYDVTVTNIQDDDARNVFAVIALPKFTTFVSATKGCTHGTYVTCKMGQMSPGTSKTATITVLPTVSGWTQATAGVRLTTPDRDPTNNSAATAIWINP